MFRRFQSKSLYFIIFLGICGCQAKRKSDAYQINISVQPPTLHPLNSEDVSAQTVHSYTFEGLLDRDLENNDWQGQLANKWEISKDGKTFTFEIRPEALWSDGKPVTAEDVKFSFDAVFDDRFKTAHLRPYYEGLAGVEVAGERKVVIRAKETYFGNFETAATMTIIPKHMYGDFSIDETRWNREIVASGPYVVKKVEQGQSITLEQNPLWWGRNDEKHRETFRFKKIRFKFVQDSNVAIEKVKKGEIDFDSLSPDDYVAKTKGEGWGTKWIKVQTQNKAPRGYGFFAFNLRSPLFQDVRTRRAMGHLFNRQMMIEKFLYGLSDLATGPWHRKSEYASPKVEPILFDPAKAQALLSEVGWKDSNNDGILDRQIQGQNTPFKFTLYLPGEDSEKFFTLFKEDLKKVGIDMSIQIMEWSAFLKIMDDGKFDALSLAWGAGSADLDPKQIWHSSSATKGGSNFINYKNPEVDRLIDEARRTMEKEKRIPILQSVYEKIAADVPYLFMFNPKFIFYIHTARIQKPKDTFNYGIGQRYWTFQESAE